jgi:hypothetical protein
MTIAPAGSVVVCKTFLSHCSRVALVVKGLTDIRLAALEPKRPSHRKRRKAPKTAATATRAPTIYRFAESHDCEDGNPALNTSVAEVSCAATAGTGEPPTFADSFPASACDVEAALFRTGSVARAGAVDSGEATAIAPTD